jgi:hypothetical protein
MPGHNLQPLSLLFPNLRSSALPRENTAVSESRSYGPDWHCGTLLGHSHRWAKSQPHHSASEPWFFFLGLKHPIIEAVFGSGNRPCALCRVLWAPFGALDLVAYGRPQPAGHMCAVLSGDMRAPISPSLLGGNIQRDGVRNIKRVACLWCRTGGESADAGIE